ncbi:Permeases of the major facilitator superfamily [Caballeronia glathei]|uniref:Amino acid ABC transporter permease n=1 Tax=Caballeronia glathei TaxID=60547 RepID=A0A069PGY6_9BURK|nr:amino acid ABC transporter permease [Caballeronia glathei]CDY78065.1 Permeases of the major facilitator superfamily [Caballeronia glathei]
MSESTPASSASEHNASLAVHRKLPPAARERARYATMAVFFIAGLLYASWGVHVPTVRDKFTLSPGMLSFALLAVAGGSIFAMLTTGSWIARAGTRAACLAGGITMTVCCALILLAPYYWLLLIVLTVFGFGMATLDVAMNAEASAVEQALARPIMSSLHGMFSIGGMAGAAAGGALLAHGMSPAMHLALASVASLVVLLVSMPAVLPHVPHHDAHAKASSSNRWRSSALWALGGLALIALVAEGAMYDWATVYMRDVVLATPAVSSAAYAAFTGGMAAGRFAGDFVRARFGAPQLVFGSAALAFVGMIAALVLPDTIVTMTGFTLMGLGLANMMPVLFAAAARVKGVTAAEGLAQVAGLAYFGLLLGPVLIGGVAQVSTLPIGLSVVAACTALIALVGPRILRRLRI